MMLDWSVILTAAITAAATFLVAFFIWFKGVRQEVHGLAQTIEGWRPFMERIVRQAATDVAERLFPPRLNAGNPSPPSNPRHNSAEHREISESDHGEDEIVLPADFKADIGTAVRGRPVGEWQSALIHLLNDIYGPERIGILIRDLGTDVDRFIEAAVKLAWRISRESRPGT